MEDRQTLIVYLPRDTYEAIDKQAKDEGTSKSAIARRVLIEHYRRLQ